MHPSPVFPPAVVGVPVQLGLSRQEMFAALALHGMLSNSNYVLRSTAAMRCLIEDAWKIGGLMEELASALSAEPASESDVPVDGVIVPSFGRGL